MATGKAAVWWQEAQAASSRAAARGAMDPVTLDRWIGELMDCKPLTEQEVESLCEKVRAACDESAAWPLWPMACIQTLA